ncbi:MAG TPA: MDR family MFS transporter [Sporichthyaceae bacterium]|nr:MDR family MFS transporter [Sporichthyaceae bacterium]
MNENRSKREILVVMSGLMIVMMLAMLDNTIISPALPTITGDLGGIQHLAWVTTAYILGATVSVPLWGKLGDILPRKAVFMTSISIFLIGSALSGLSQSMNQLIGFRALQGIGAGDLMTGVMASMAVLVSPRDRGKYTGYLMAVMPVSMIGGPLAGGWITDNFSWRWNFYINLPVGLAAMLVLARTMKLPPNKVRQGRFDWQGSGLSIAWITSAVLATSWAGTQYSWGSPVILGLFALAAAGLARFIWVELHVAEPVVPLRVFANRNFAVASGLRFMVGFGMFGAMTFLPQYQQYVQGASATQSGLLMLPMMAGVVLMSLTSGRVISKSGKYRIFPIAGSALMIAGLGLLSLLGVDTGRVETGAFMFVLGLGMGCMFSSTQTIAQNSVPLTDISSATATTSFMQSIGGSLGISLFGALYAHTLTADTGGQFGKGLSLPPDALKSMPHTVVATLQAGISDGATNVFAVAACVSILGLVGSLFIKQVQLRGSIPKQGTAAPEPVMDIAHV